MVQGFFCHVDMVPPTTRFSAHLVVSQVPEFSQASMEHRLNLLYESHPAETQVDGLPRAASVKNQSKSLILYQLHQFKIAGYIFLTPTRVIVWHMQNLSSIHRLSEKFEWWIGFHCPGGTFEKNMKFWWKVMNPWDFWRSNLQNRFAKAKKRCAWTQKWLVETACPLGE